MWGWFESPARVITRSMVPARGPQRFMLACVPCCRALVPVDRGDRDGLRRADHGSGGLERRPRRGRARPPRSAVSSPRAETAGDFGTSGSCSGSSHAAGAAAWSIWTWYESVLGREVPFPSLADVGYLGAVPFAAAALITLPNGVRRPLAGRVRTVIDGLMIAGSLLADELGTRARPSLRGRRRQRPLAGDQPRLPGRRRGRGDHRSLRLAPRPPGGRLDTRAARAGRRRTRCIRRRGQRLHLPDGDGVVLLGQPTSISAGSSGTC